MPSPAALASAGPAVLRALVGAAVVPQADSGDPVPFPPVEGRLTDWLGLALYAVLVVAVCLVAWRMARSPAAPTPAPAARDEPPSDAPPSAAPPASRRP